MATEEQNIRAILRIIDEECENDTWLGETLASLQRADQRINEVLKDKEDEE